MALLTLTADTTTTTAEGGTTFRFNENLATDIRIGTIRNTTAGLSYRFASQNGDMNGRYKLVERAENGVTVLDVVVAVGGDTNFNFEALAQHQITVEGYNGATRVDAGSFAFNLTNVNEKPVSVWLGSVGNTSVTIQENRPVDTVIASLGVVDPDNLNSTWGRPSVRYQIDPTDPRANLYKIVNTGTQTSPSFSLVVNGTIDYDALPAGEKWHDIKIIATDGGGLSVTQTLRINLTNDTGDDNVNQAPHTVRLDNATNLVIAENTNFDGALSAQDDGLPTGSALSYSFDTTAAGGGNANGLFTIVNGRIQLAAGRTLDYEAGTTYTIYVRASDGNLTSATQAITFNLTNVNERPTDIGLSGTSVSSTAGGGTAIGNLTFVDPDAGATGNYTIFNDPNAYFQIGAGAGGVPQLQVRNGATLAAGTYNVTVRVTDQGNLTYDKQFTITVTSGNTRPTDISLSGTTVAEDQTGGALIGNLSATDAQGGQMTFTIVGDAGSKFAINSSGQLVVRDGATFNYEANDTHVVRVRVTDSGGLWYEEDLTITVTNVNERPTDIGLSGTSISTTAGGGTAIGNLSFADPDAGATGNYTIFNDPNAYFQIGAGAGGVPQLQVRNGATLAAGTYNVTVRVTDQGNLTYDKQFTITVTSGNTRPTDISLSGTTVAEDQTGGALIGNLSATDAQGGQMTFSVLNDPDSKFEVVVVGGVAQLRVRDGATFNYEGKTTHDVRIQVTDSGGLTYDELFTITVNNVNERPTDIGLTGTSVSSTAGGGTAIGNLSFADPDAGATGNYTILSDPNGYFQIGTGGGFPQLQVRDGATLAAGTYTVTVRVTDQGNLTYDKQFTINVVNGNVKPRIEGADSPIVKTTPDTANVQPFDKVTIFDSGPLTVVVTMDNAGKGTFEGTGTYNPAAGTFSIFGTAQEVTAALQALRFNARDKAAGAGTEATNFTITVTDNEGGPGGTTTNTNISVTAQAPVLPGQNQAPNDIVVLSGGAVQELAGSSTPVATFGATDPDDAGGFVYSIVNPDGRFAISGNQLVVANGVMLDFEQATSHTVRVRVTDKSGTGLSYEENITIGVTDVARELMNPASASPLNDIIKASKTLDSKDVLYGGAGDDKLWGGYGNDTLWGGVGKDVFVFEGKLGTSSTDRKVNFDTIKDYDVKNDSIWLENTLFKSNKALYASTKKGVETKPAKLASKFFTVGDKAKDSDDYFVYDAKKRVLYYDADGSGSKAAIELAIFTNNKALKNFKATELFLI